MIKLLVLKIRPYFQLDLKQFQWLIFERRDLHFADIQFSYIFARSYSQDHYDENCHSPTYIAMITGVISLTICRHCFKLRCEASSASIGTKSNGFLQLYLWDIFCISVNEPVPYSPIRHFVTEMCTLMLQNNALRDLWDGSKAML